MKGSPETNHCRSFDVWLVSGLPFTTAVGALRAPTTRTADLSVRLRLLRSSCETVSSVLSVASTQGATHEKFAASFVLPVPR